MAEVEETRAFLKSEAGKVTAEEAFKSRWVEMSYKNLKVPIQVESLDTEIDFHLALFLRAQCASKTLSPLFFEVGITTTVSPQPEIS